MVFSDPMMLKSDQINSRMVDFGEWKGLWVDMLHHRGLKVAGEKEEGRDNGEEASMEINRRKMGNLKKIHLNEIHSV